jgi:hypothetical protein
MRFVHLYPNPCVSLVFSAYKSVQFCLSLYTRFFNTLYLLVIAFACSKLINHSSYLGWRRNDCDHDSDCDRE